MTTSSAGSSSASGSPRRRFGWVVAPLVVFGLLAIAFAFSLSQGDPSKLPSALIGKPAPQTAFDALEGLRAADQPVAGFASTDLGGGTVKVVNFWASWCVPCVDEHPLLIALKERTGVPIYGVNYKDQPTAARRFIGRYGNPYEKVGVDPTGRGAIEWGVYGMPETFVIDGAGRIAYKHVGPISEQSLVRDVIPAIEKARQAAP
ncbi:MAG: disulfide bond formation protein DsbE [Alphaproteobacteria bacterium BRH_c36]|nr:MAG: disulfide bond formation protein DsbE [Alphaproteobacteria bacterium BRH_c36]